MGEAVPEGNSVICTGSHLNRRTIGDDESWNSLQSTILAGNVELEEPRKDVVEQKLNTVQEECSLVILEDDSGNILDMNLDALSNDSVFLDDADKSNEAMPLLTDIITFPETITSSVDSGIDANEGTGFLIQRMFLDLERCATHSTPSDSVQHQSLLSRAGMSKKHFEFDQDSLQDTTIYEDLSGISKNSIISPLVANQARVRQMKQYFESIMKKKSGPKSPSVKVYATNAKSKKSKIPVLKKPSFSCSDYPSGSRLTSARSKSESDSSVKVMFDNQFVTQRKRAQVRRHNCVQHPTSGVKQSSVASSKSSSSKASSKSRANKGSFSALNARRSMGIVSSPIKSVQVIRKIFSPSPRGRAHSKIVAMGVPNNSCKSIYFKKNTRPEVPKIVVTPCYGKD